MSEMSKKCLFCTNHLQEDTKPQHIIPKSIGGSLAPKNITCTSCNEYFGKNLDNLLSVRYELIMNSFGELLVGTASKREVELILMNEKRVKINPGGKPKPYSEVVRDKESGKEIIYAANEKEGIKIARGKGMFDKAVLVKVKVDSNLNYIQNLHDGWFPKFSPQEIESIEVNIKIKIPTGLNVEKAGENIWEFVIDSKRFQIKYEDDTLNIFNPVTFNKELKDLGDTKPADKNLYDNEIVRIMAKTGIEYADYIVQKKLKNRIFELAADTLSFADFVRYEGPSDLISLKEVHLYPYCSEEFKGFFLENNFPDWKFCHRIAVILDSEENKIWTIVCLYGKELWLFEISRQYFGGANSFLYQRAVLKSNEDEGIGVIEKKIELVPQLLKTIISKRAKPDKKTSGKISDQLRNLYHDSVEYAELNTNKFLYRVLPCLEKKGSQNSPEDVLNCIETHLKHLFRYNENVEAWEQNWKEIKKEKYQLLVENIDKFKVSEFTFDSDFVSVLETVYKGLFKLCLKYIGRPGKYTVYSIGGHFF